MKSELTDLDILSRLSNLEDSFVERKTEGDSGDWVKTVVAFANSAPIGYPALLFIGVKDDGTVQGLGNPDSTQRSLSSKLANAFPQPYYLSRVLDANGSKFLAVIVPGSEFRPHFAGLAFVREGSRTIGASEEQFAEGVVSDCTQFYVTITGSAFSSSVSFSLDAFDIGFDHKLNRLELRFRAPFG